MATICGPSLGKFSCFRWLHSTEQLFSLIQGFKYVLSSNQRYLMFDRVRALVMLALLQVTIVIGILAMPLALASQRLGISLPIDGMVRRATTAYEQNRA